MNLAALPDSKRYLFEFPFDQKSDQIDVCGLIELDEGVVNTFTNFACKMTKSLRPYTII